MLQGWWDGQTLILLRLDLERKCHKIIKEPGKKPGVKVVLCSGLQ